MAKVKVRLFFDLIPSSNKSELEVEASDLKGLLASLSREYGDDFRQPLYGANGKARPYSFVYHNGVAHRLKDVPNLGFKDGDLVLFVPAVGGG